MALNKVEICGVDTSKLPVLSQKDMRALLLRVKQGDTDARDEFLRSNLRLVLSVIQRFVNRGEQMDDLFQVGCIGLIKALDNFDLSHDVKFSTYAVPMNVSSRKLKRSVNMSEKNRQQKPPERPIKKRCRRPKEKPRYKLQSEGGIEAIERKLKSIDIEIRELQSGL